MDQPEGRYPHQDDFVGAFTPNLWAKEVLALFLESAKRRAAIFYKGGKKRSPRCDRAGHSPISLARKHYYFSNGDFHG